MVGYVGPDKGIGDRVEMRLYWCCGLRDEEHKECSRARMANDIASTGKSGCRTYVLLDGTEVAVI